MSGFEVLGLAFSVFQTISFARETTTMCRDVYQGQKTPDDALRETAGALKTAAGGIRSHRPANDAERKLDKIAQSCSEAAVRLESEVQKITDLHKKGAMKAVIKVRWKSFWKKDQIEELDKSFCRYRDTLQVLLVNDLCDSDRAAQLRQRKDFEGIDRQIQEFIKAIEAGNTNLHSLLQSESKATRDHVTQQAEETSEFIKAHIVKGMQTDRREVQRDRFLQSLKFPGMNERRSKIMDPEDASLSRIFRAFENSSETSMMDDVDALGNESLNSRVDKVWRAFVDWLASDDDFFWIQGKPGSGKSTLVKSIIEHDLTQKLLDTWKPETRMISHFFWLLGPSKHHTNARGLYLSILSQILEKESKLIDQLLCNDSLARKEDHTDWSVSELRKTVLSILSSHTPRSSLCIFIDGIDEYCDEDDFTGLIDRIMELSGRDGLKVCVAGRPEPEFRRKFGLKAHLKLHELTWSEMEAFVQLHLAPLEEDHLIDEHTLRFISYELLGKAQGVFLWLHLALRTLKRGIGKGDSTELLLRRVNELPSELDDLYADMWQRLNRDTQEYREVAAWFFKLVIDANLRHQELSEKRFYTFCWLECRSRPTEVYFDGKKSITLFEILCIRDPELRAMAVRESRVFDLEELEAQCQKLKEQIVVQTAGMLEVGDSLLKKLLKTGADTLANGTVLREVAFVHRTAQDFLNQTLAGQKILSHATMEPSALELATTEALLCSVRLTGDEFSVTFESRYVLSALEFTWKAINLHDPATRRGLWKLTSNIQQLFDTGLICEEYCQYAQPTFVSKLFSYLGGNDPDITAFFLDFVTASSATSVMRDTLTPSFFQEVSERAIDVDMTETIQSLLGKLKKYQARPYDVEIVRSLGTSLYVSVCRSIALWGLALSICLGNLVGVRQWDAEYGVTIESVAEDVITMVSECPPATLDKRGFVIGRVNGWASGHSTRCDPMQRRPDLKLDRSENWVTFFDARIGAAIPIFDVSVRFLSDIALARLPSSAERIDRLDLLQSTGDGDNYRIPFVILTTKHPASLNWVRFDDRLRPSALAIAYLHKDLGNIDQETWISEGYPQKCEKEYSEWAREVWKVYRAGELEEVNPYDVFNSFPEYLGPCTLESAGLDSPNDEYG